MPFKYGRYGEPITAMHPGIMLEIWQDDINHVFTKNQIKEYKDTSFAREYTLRYMGEKILVQAPSKDILTELEDVP